MAYNTIKIKKYSDVIEECEAAAALYPGALIEIDSNGAVQNNSDSALICQKMVALEDELQGNGIDDAFAAEDWVQCWIMGPGDVAYMILYDGENVVIGDYLESNGDGTLIKLVSGVALFVALEALDLSGSSGAETSGELGYNKRIAVRAL